MEKYTVTIPDASDPQEAKQIFLEEIRSWVYTCINRYRHEPPLANQHDQGTYTTAWEPYIRETGDETALSFMKDLRDRIASAAQNRGEWKHGYWKYNEAHHGTEHFELFLGTLFRLDSQDTKTIRQIEDAAEHFGNWVSGIPAWFNWETGLYRSMFFGTEKIGEAAGCSLNVPDHLRCANIAGLAYHATGQERYLRLCASISKPWAKAAVACSAFPLALNEKGGVYSFAKESEQAYRSFVGALPQNLDSPLDRVENLLASGGIDGWLHLYALTQENLYRQAARRAADELACVLDDPDAGAAVALLREYDRITGENRYSPKVIQTASRLDPFSFSSLTLQPCKRTGGRPSGIGKRADMSVWYEDDQLRTCSPVLLGYAAQLLHDSSLAARTWNLCTAYLRAARLAYPDGRHHGCSAQSVSAVARGHGRENNTGVVTGVLGWL